MTTGYPDFNPDYRDDAPTIADVEAWTGYAILEFGTSWYVLVRLGADIVSQLNP